MKLSVIHVGVGSRGMWFIWVLGLYTLFSLQLNAAKQATVNRTAEALAGVVADEKALPAARLDALKALFSKHFKPQGTLAETADFFKYCRWIKKGDWEVLYAFAGSWPFEDTDIFSATPERTQLVAVRMNPSGLNFPNGVWLGFPRGEKITEPEIEMILSGKCPERLAKIRLLDGSFEYHSNNQE
ncbi:MAG: hypothetical protein NTY98_27685 [Verrucomicrobia bacterium]|nr:hypothetical protein [Verrucomicrobiota bacterium]